MKLRNETTNCPDCGVRWVYDPMHLAVSYRRNLWMLLDQRVPGDIVELGVAEGNFAQEMLAWPLRPPARRLYLVDRWASVPGQKGDGSNPPSWHEANWQRVQQRFGHWGSDSVVILRGRTVEMADCVADASCALVYVDADHAYEAVREDIVHWWPKLVPGGIMAFHDFLNPAYGVRRAVEEFARHTNLLIHPLPEDKDEDAGAYIEKPYADPI